MLRGLQSRCCVRGRLRFQPSTTSTTPSSRAFFSSGPSGAKAKAKRVPSEASSVPFAGLKRSDLSGRSTAMKMWGSARMLTALLFCLASLYMIDSAHFGFCRGLNRLRSVLTEAWVTSLYYKYMLWRAGDSDAERAETLSRCHETAAHHVLSTVLGLGGVYVKIGQLVSTMTMTLPLEWCIVMRSCLDEARAMAPAAVLRVVSGAPEDGGLNEHPLGLYGDFDYVPHRAASVAQVHLAREKKTLDRLAVKVQYEDIGTEMRYDFHALKAIAYVLGWEFECDFGWIPKYFEKSIVEELDFVREAMNCERFSAMFADWPEVSAPRVVKELTSPRVLTMQFIDGFNVNEHERLDVLGIDRQRVADLAAEVVSASIFEHGFLHADPHPANIFVQPLNNTHVYGLDAVRRRSRRDRGRGADGKPLSFTSFLNRQEPPEDESFISKLFITPRLYRHVTEFLEERQLAAEAETEAAATPDASDTPSLHPSLTHGHAGQIPYALPPLVDGETRWKMQWLDHGSYQELSAEFRRSYAELWRGVGLGDYAGVVRATEGLGVDNARMLASILVGTRGGGGGGGASAATPVSGTTKASESLSKEDFHVPYAADTNMTLGMLEVMGVLPPEMVLVLKCNALLRSIQGDLRAAPTYQRIMAEGAVRYLAREKLREAETAAERRAATSEEAAALRRIREGGCL
eukprot:Rhum_TRINITY_DN13098_c0_g1::Rhum_TRINITY_DN13098_c0_g1_i1::g.56945::m.56945/K08869/ADCK, ABC1; aarF domain-containing kinase